MPKMKVNARFHWGRNIFLNSKNNNDKWTSSFETKKDDPGQIKYLQILPSNSGKREHEKGRSNEIGPLKMPQLGDSRRPWMFEHFEFFTFNSGRSKIPHHGAAPGCVIFLPRIFPRFLPKYAIDHFHT